jgi:hypothetical protein
METQAIQAGAANRKVHWGLAIFVTLVAFLTYLRTMASTTSFWDCGEFIACSKILGVIHPPGAPLYLLIGRLFTMLPVFKDIGMRVNLFSVLIGAATVTFTYLAIVQLVRRWKGDPKTWEERLSLYGGGALGAMAFAFTDSFWFNAVEAEVYAFSMLFTSIVVWLALAWEEQSQKASSMVLILFIFYLFALAFGVHLLNFLVFPFVLLIAFFHDNQTVRRFLTLLAVQAVVPLTLYLLLFQFNPEKMNYPDMMAHQDRAFNFLKWFGVLWVAASLAYMYKKDRTVFKVWWVVPALAIFSYTVYLVIFIRANQHPPINENDPSTIAGISDYLARKQYGTESMVLTLFHRKADFWSYQVNKMYTRYFGWQFIGRGLTLDSQDRIVEIISLKGLYGIPFSLGLWGAVTHFIKDWKRALAVGVLFFMTGYAIILYLNQPDPQPRERDYSYVGSFFAFALWIGIGATSVFEWISDALKKKPLLKKAAHAAAAVLLVVAVPVNLFAFNFHSHDRTGNYVAWDYSYNILQTCEPEAILFTNGDNDTFPLWYLQEVEGIRKDVRIVNLSLLNTPWYIQQLRDEAPKVPINLSNEAIQSLAPMEWKTREMEIAVPPDVRKTLQESLGDSIKVQVPEKIAFTVKPTFNSGGVQGIRVQDLMVMQILYANAWRRPVYYAVTVSSDNMIGLSDYFRMDGLAFKIVPYTQKELGGNEINPKVLENNILNMYRYRNLNNPKVYNDINILKLLQNYRSAFMQLTQWYLDRKRSTDALRVLETMTRVVPDTVIPYSDERAALYINELFRRAGKTVDFEEQLRRVIPGQSMSKQELYQLASYYTYSLKDWDKAERILRQVLQSDRNDLQAYGELLRLYGLSQQHSKAATLLEEYLMVHPEDTSAANELQRLRRAIAQADTGPAPKR